MASPVAMLLKKRKICDPYLHITDNELARALRKLVAENVAGWRYAGGIRYGHLFAWEKERENITVEEFLHTGSRDDGWRHNLLSTYSRCIDIDVVADTRDDTDIEFVAITVYEGDNYDGGRNAKRCTLYLEGPWWNIKEFANKVERKWVQYTTAIVETEEQRRLEARRQVVADEVLAGTYPFPEDEDSND